jgi:hypothetical protein
MSEPNLDKQIDEIKAKYAKQRKEIEDAINRKRANSKK